MKYFVALFLALALIWSASAHAQRVGPVGGGVRTSAGPAMGQSPAAPSGMHERIVAVVNDNVISSTDLQARLAMALLASGLPDTPEVRAHLTVQLLHTMIDEQLQLQEAKKNDIKVEQSEINAAMEKISQDNHIPGGDIKAFLQSRGVPPEALITQIKAGLSWSKVIQRELRPRVDVGDDEIDAVIERTRADAGKQEYLVSEIFLSVDNPKDEQQVQQFAANLVQQLKGGANFGAIARQFSQSASAAAGGDIGWIRDGQLSPEMNKTLVAMATGSMSDPIRSSSGYHILGLRDKRTITVGGDATDTTAQLQQVFRQLSAGVNQDAVAKEAASIRSSISSCDGLKDKIASQYNSWHWQDLGEVHMSTAPVWLANKARSLPVGKASEPMAANGGVLMLFVCSRKAPEGNADRDAIANQIGGEKLELQARGLLRDLRREAYLDVRLTSGS